MYLYTSASLQGMFIQWEHLGTPPGKAVSVVTPNSVKTETGDVYQNCGSSCWVKSQNPPPNYNYFPLKNCGKLPSLPNSIDFKANCQPYGLGMLLVVIAIDKNGSVHSWNQTIGAEWDGLVLFLSPFLGALGGLLVGFIILLIILFSDFVEWLQKRALERNSLQTES